MNNSHLLLPENCKYEYSAGSQILKIEPDAFAFFSSGVHGIVLSVDGDENCVMLTLLTEDDENWFVSKNATFSSYWLKALRGLCQEVEDWLVVNCEPYIINGRQCGFLYV